MKNRQIVIDQLTKANNIIDRLLENFPAEDEIRDESELEEYHELCSAQDAILQASMALDLLDEVDSEPKLRF